VLTEEQIAWLRTHAATTPRKEIAAHLGLLLRNLTRQLARLGLAGLRKPPEWSDEETRILRAMAPAHFTRSIAKRLCRDPQTVQKEARRLGIPLLDWKAGCAREQDDLRRMTAEGLTIKQMAARMGKSYNAVLMRLQKLGLTPVRDLRARSASPVRPNPLSRKKHPWAAPTPAPARERIGLPVAGRRTVVRGSVAWCSRCCAPVVDTPQSWAEHNLRVHVAPIRRIA
jgi:hypothetical protein